MTNRWLVAAALVAVALLAIPAQAGDPAGTSPAATPELNWHKLDKGLDAAQAENKHIMVDVYTDWCGWCKKLERETYSDSAVREVLAESYISVKLKGDSDAPMGVIGQTTQDGDKVLMQFSTTDQATTTERQLTRGPFRVTGFPTILFLASDGKVITKLPGFKDAGTFKNILNFIKDDLYEVMSYQDYLESLDAQKTEGGGKS